MSRKIQDTMIERVCRRLQGDMDSQEAAQFDLDLQSNARLARTYRQMFVMESAFASVPELTPAANFTASVLRKTRPAVLPEKETATWLDWLVGLAPAVGLLVIAVVWGRDLWGRAVGEISQGAGWLDTTLGTQLFADQPFILLGALIPVAILGVAYAVMHESWGAEV